MTEQPSPPSLLPRQSSGFPGFSLKMPEPSPFKEAGQMRGSFSQLSPAFPNLRRNSKSKRSNPPSPPEDGQAKSPSMSPQDDPDEEKKEEEGGEQEEDEESEERWREFKQEEPEQKDDDVAEVVSFKSVVLYLLTIVLFVVNYLQFNNISIYTQMRDVAQSALENGIGKISLVNTDFQDYLEDKIGKLYEQPSFVANYTTERENAYWHFLSQFNYVIGSSFTTRLTRYVPNKHPNTRGIVQEVRDGFYTDAGQSFSGEYREEAEGIQYSSKGGFQNKGGYHIFFDSTWQKEGSEYRASLTKMKQFLQRNDTLEFSFTTILYNINTQYSLYYSQAFALNNAGVLASKTESIGFTSQYYDIEAVGRETYILRLLMDILFMFFQLLMVVQLLFVLYNAVKEAWKIKSCTLEWYYYVDIIVLGLVGFSIFQLITIYLTPPFRIPQTSEADFQLWEQYAFNITQYYFVSSLAICFMFIRSLRILNSIFPSFSVLFDTIRKSGSELCYFLLLMVTLLLGFVVMAYVIFGTRLEHFRALNIAFMKLFVMMLGSINYYELEEASPTVAPIFFFSYMILFFFIILNMFLAIVMATYAELQKQKGEDTIATAALVKLDAKDYCRKVVNLFLCKQPEIAQKHRKKEQQKASLRRREQEQQAKRQEMKCKDVFLYNFTQVCCSSGKRQTVEELEVRREEMKQKIAQERDEAKKAKMDDENDQFKQYSLLSQGCVFIFFIVIFGTLAGLVLKTDQSYLASMSISENLQNNKFNNMLLSQVSDVGGMERWMWGFLKDQQDFKDFSYYNYYFGPVQFRGTLRFVELKDNLDRDTNPVADRVRSTQDFDPKAINNNREFKSFIKGLFPNYEGTDIRYHGPGTIETAFQAGGYTFNLEAHYDDLVQEFTAVTKDLLDEKFGSLTMQFVTYNPNMNYVAISSVVFWQKAVGVVATRVYVDYMQTDIYKGSRIARVLVEILYFLMILYYIRQEVVQWLSKEAELREEARERREARLKEEGKEKEGAWREETRFVRLVKYMGFSHEVFVKDSAVVKVIKLIVGAIVTLLRWIYYFLKVTYLHLTQDFFNMLDSSSLVLSILNVVYWGMIVHKFYSAAQQDFIGEFEEMGSLFQTLKLVIGVNSLIIFLRLLQFFKFNKKLSILSDVISSASTDAGFFLLMFTIVLLGFSIWGNTLFGLKNDKYSDVFLAVHHFFLMVTGDFDYDGLVSSGDADLSPFYFIVFMVLFNLLLLNMFIAIISEHYGVIYEEDKEMEQKDQDQGKPKVNMCRRISALLRYRCSPKYKEDLRNQQQNSLRLCIFCIRCLGKGNEPSYVKDAPPRDPTRCPFPLCCLRRMQKKSKCATKRRGKSAVPPLDTDAHDQSNLKDGATPRDGNNEDIVGGILGLVGPDDVEIQDEDSQDKEVANFRELYLEKKQDLDQKELKKLRQIIDLPDQEVRRAKSQYDLQSQASWLRVLESALKRLTTGKLRLNEFASQDEPQNLAQRYEHNFTNLEMAYVNEDRVALLRGRSLRELYRIFRALRYMEFTETADPESQQLSYPKFQEAESQRFEENRDFRKFRKFWDTIESGDQLELWLQHFTPGDRTALWDKLPFTQVFFAEEEEKMKYLTEKEAPERMNDGRQWRCLFPMHLEKQDKFEKLKWLRSHYLDYLLVGHQQKKKKIIRLPWLHKLQREDFENKHGATRYHTVKRFLNEGEARVQLWFALSQIEKVEMIKLERDDEEARFLLMLLAEEYKQEDFQLQQVSALLETHLDALIYNKYSLLCQWQAIRAGNFHILRLIRDKHEEDKGLIDYMGMLKTKQKRLQEQERQLYHNQRDWVRILDREVRPPRNFEESPDVIERKNSQQPSQPSMPSMPSP